MGLIYTWRNDEASSRDSEDFTVRYNADSDEVSWDQASLWEPAINDRYWYSGKCRGDDWLRAYGTVFVQQENVRLGWSGLSSSYEMSLDEAVQRLLTVARGDDLEHAYLDSFFIIENGESARRVDREIEPSPCQKALLHCIAKMPQAVSSMSPREFEVLVAHTLKEIGFTRVTLRRYTKDSGIDIVAIMASSNEVDERVVVEVKHGHQGITLSVLDRLNGVRDRVSADRALAVSSAHVSRDARLAYEAKRNYITAYTFRELTAILADSDDWISSPSGLWTKGLGRNQGLVKRTPNQGPQPDGTATAAPRG